jgi:transmembrane sensor
VLAWRRGQLVFVQAPLRTVVAEIRRYRAGLVLLDPRAADRPVTAILDLDRLDTAMDALAGSLGLVATRLTPWLLTLRA